MSLALLQVGINKYPWAPLQGCLNDCANLSARFSQLGMLPARREFLQDATATRFNILAGLRWLIEQQAETLIFQYSGHGTRVRDLSGDEASGYDSGICPIDFESAGIILDDELGALYDQVSTDQRLIVLFDSCYSGKSQRKLTRRLKRMVRASTPRFLPDHLIPPVSRRPDPDNPPLTHRTSFLKNNERSVLISTCRQDQTSADAYIGRLWQGAGTAALLWSWNKCGAEASYLDVAKNANAWLKANGYDQVLRVEAQDGTQTREMFT